MFLRSKRLFLRPAWLEDAPALAHAIGHKEVARMLAAVPWPYGADDARQFIGLPRDPYLPNFLVTLPEEGGRIVGGCGLHDGAAGVELGYWITPDSWARGYATEAACGLLSIARLIGHDRLIARHAVDNPASGRVLRKLGFRPTGRTQAFASLGRKAQVDGVEYALDLEQADGPCLPPMRAAA